ncbi:hypothetical protein Osc7112_2729 [Oscillatoria nigro-viridis PCC 7112]|uniref:Uncharacterized protein n=1 Tax=Phormidium nigroviride PCC 7112 TaxID=179408 RepID=K9VHZ9_9CYAN|nr:hypothetical protein [Oscillatoria nigro-viridis]AFZ07139.1 hypothetical protein Osc7112_2729 [Oscillatoria nigro-viridis PCC 7112]
MTESEIYSVVLFRDASVRAISKLSVAIATTLLSTVVTATQAGAVPVTYDFIVTVTKGGLAGNSFNGSFTYDDAKLKGTGVEELGIAEGLTTCINYLGRTYRETDDTSYPNFPTLRFEDGKIAQLNFWVQPNQRVSWWNSNGWEVKLSEPQMTDSTVPNCQKR